MTTASVLELEGEVIATAARLQELVVRLSAARRAAQAEQPPLPLLPAGNGADAPETWLTVEQAAEEINLPAATIYAYLVPAGVDLDDPKQRIKYAEHIPNRRIGRAIRIGRSALHAWMAGRQGG